MVTCEIKTDGVTITMAKGYKGSDNSYTVKTTGGERPVPGSEQMTTSYESSYENEDVYFMIIEETPNKDSDDAPVDDPGDDPDEDVGDDPDEDVIVIVLPGPHGREILDDTSREPMDYDFIKRIKDSMDSASKDRQAAYNEYMKNTESYYKKTYAALKEKAGDFKSENIELTKYFKGLASAETAETGKRELIDDAVAYIAREAEIAGDEKIVTMEFLTAEKTYREQFLKIGKEVYDRKIEKILEYIDALINELLGSRLGLYFNKTKDKIDVIINLPKLTEKE